jgi:hypothetical protein
MSHFGRAARRRARRDRLTGICYRFFLDAKDQHRLCLHRRIVCLAGYFGSGLVRTAQRSVRRVQTEQEGRGSAIRRSHRGYVEAYHVAIEAFALRLPLTWLS